MSKLKVIFYTNDNYEYQAKALIESALLSKDMDKMQLIYYTIGFNSSLSYPNLIKRFFPEDPKKPRFELYKPDILLDALRSFGSGKFLCLDSDIIFGRRFSISKITHDYDFPMSSMGTWDKPFKNFYENGVCVNMIDETNLMNYLGVKERTMNYIYTNIISFDERSEDLIKEWASFCNNEYIVGKRDTYLPFNEESILNVLLWKRGINKNFGRIYLNTLEFEPVKYIEENDDVSGDPSLNYGIMCNNLMRCDNSSNVIFYHGIKDKNELNRVIDYLKNKNIDGNISKFKNSEETRRQYIDVINNTEIINRNPPKRRISFTQHFVGNPFFEILGNTNDDFRVEFYDKEKLYYSSNLKCNMWSKLNRKYFTEWITKVYCDDELIYDNKINLKDKRVYISLDSKSIGDSVAWIPYMEEFRKKHECVLIVSTFWNNLFKNSYPNIEFIEPGSVANNLHAMYTIGCFHNINMEPELTNTIPLQKVCTNILGLEYKEIRPKIYFEPKIKPYDSKYVVIAPHSTAGLKYWNNPTGWQEVVDFLLKEGYKVINISREGCDFKGVISLKDFSIENILNVIHHSEFMIGLSSGMPWLNWALGKKSIMIANFTKPDHEFSENCVRITNNSVCNGCWNNPNFKFDKGDWNWCPIYKGTDKQFECSKSITGEMVINKIKEIHEHR